MPVERIDRYKKTARLKFQNAETEAGFQKFQAGRGRSSGIYALSALIVIILAYAFLEFWIIGVNSLIPMYAYLAIAAISVVSLVYSVVSDSDQVLRLRVLGPGLLTLLVVLGSVAMQQYRIYHAVEISLLTIWLAGLAALNFRLSGYLSIATLAVFIAVAFLFGADGLKLDGLIAMSVAVLAISMAVAYMGERNRRMLYLNQQGLLDAYNRQQNWAFTLIDLDLALSGIRDFKELTARLVERMKQVIHYDSYVFTSLEGKGPKPRPDQMEGSLFEDEDVTLWPDDLMAKLAQTRHAVTSSHYEMKRGFLGRKSPHFQHFRLDVPVFNDSNLVGVISLRRSDEAYDDLDMTASVSLASQAMMIFKRTQKSTQMSETLLKQLSGDAGGARKPVRVEKPGAPPPEVKVARTPAGDSSAPGAPARETEDIDITQDSTQSDIKERRRTQGKDETVVPAAVIEKIRQETETARKTITLLSRENADKIAVDKYRTAAVEGEPLSILLIEVDGLSSIRENEGDQTAYRVFAGIVKHVFSVTNKDKDVLGRYGQNGMSVLLPRVDMNAAEKFAESIRRHVEETVFKTSYGDRKATLSIGVAAITDETGNYESMVKRADMALFVAKKNGRNCVKVRL